MINLHSPVKQGFIVNQDGQFEINGLIIRGSTNVALKALHKQDGEELSGGMELDLPSMIDFCKRVLIETEALPKWFFIGVIIDARHGQLLTYFSPTKEKFFSDIYSFIQENLKRDLPLEDTEMVVKEFFDHNLDYRFSYIVVPLDSLLSGSAGGREDLTDIRL